MQRPTDNLRLDHALVGRGMAALSALAEGVRAGAALPRADTVAAIHQRLARLTELEEGALFPLCEAQVPADDQLEWLAQFETLERQRTSRRSWERELAPICQRWCA
jgi:hypothetical protein